MERRPAYVPFLAPLALALLLLACGGDDDAGAGPDEGAAQGTRPFLMGVSSLPADPSEQAYRHAFRLAGEAGEVVLIQRPPPWADFVPGATISERTENLTRLERDLARDNHLKLFLAIDPTEPTDRGRLAALPDELRGRDFSDDRVRAAFVAYAKYLALNYKPAYLALGVEVDMYFARRGDAAFRNFTSLYFEAYDAVKDVSSNTLVFPTFQYENMLGILDSRQAALPAWSLVNRFQPKIDMLAVSSFPGLVFKGVSTLPSDYYQPLTGRSEKPVAFVSVGWSSAALPSDSGREGEGEQLVYLSTALAAAEKLGARLFIWYLGRDPVVSPATAFSPLAATGLFRPDGQPKGAWSIWRRYSERRHP